MSKTALAIPSDATIVASSGGRVVIGHVRELAPGPWDARCPIGRRVAPFSIVTIAAKDAWDHSVVRRRISCSFNCFSGR